MVTSNSGTKKIMVVEDFDDTRSMMKLTLELRGYDVVEAANGQEAVEIAEREQPDLILMDLDLPILDGIAAMHRIRKNVELQNVPVVAVTAYPLSYSRVKAFSEGCNEYLAKPIDFDELSSLLTRYLS
jgi:two-component system, cell cycle response regulator DivK